MVTPGKPEQKGSAGMFQDGMSPEGSKTQANQAGGQDKESKEKKDND